MPIALAAETRADLLVHSPHPSAGSAGQIGLGRHEHSTSIRAAVRSGSFLHHVVIRTLTIGESVRAIRIDQHHCSAFVRRIFSATLQLGNYFIERLACSVLVKLNSVFISSRLLLHTPERAASTGTRFQKNKFWELLRVCVSVGS